MINPYAQTFMIAARTDRIAPPRLREAQDAKPRRRFRLFRFGTQRQRDDR
ncbi:MAG: hypothetical protein QNJ16_13440 [Rhodobacter sp.]|nr:hypothetical protein [Rhodobacter sp.]